MTALAMKQESPQKAISNDIPPVSVAVPRICLVTGGTGGIGSEICQRLAKAGHVVATTYRNEEKAKAWKAEMAKQGYTFHIYKCDVANFEETGKVIKSIVADLGPITVLGINAGITRDSTLRKMTVDQWRDVIANDLDSVFNVTRPVLDYMLESNFGRIINISSNNGQKSQFGQSNYAAAKTGMHGFTKTQAQKVRRSPSAASASPRTWRTLSNS